MNKIDKKRKFIKINIALITISDTRDLTNDKSGNLLNNKILKFGHHLYCREIIKDDVELIKKKILKYSKNKSIDVVLTTGGTGLTGRDSTPEALLKISDKIIEGFGELFRYISYNKIGTSTIQSRAVAAIVKGTYVFCLPGSINACKDAWDKILKYQLDNRYRPCNFIEIMPRLKER
ncbi:MAG: molybdenum cofactor biosynthesis protein B [Rickettsiales bacterium]|nr:molybdenum cofactor biosynthesis protein B [Rickettsiales bacterium]